jgi:gamma-glutamylcyclotransferase (GGCT)/AIG2-like uncharacterized protein YtfP
MLVKEKGKQVNFRYMDNAQKHNKDGYSVAWYENGFVKTYKTFNYSTFKGVVAALKQYTIVVHLRHATKGIKDYNNIHPFEIPTGVMFHNGTMFGLGDSQKSDSQELADTISECEYKAIEDIMPLIKPYINDKINRLVFFEDTGRITIMNKHLGIVEDGVWYSNDYHLKKDSWCRGGVCKTEVVKKKAENTIADKTHTVFVYGTLKRGYSNNSLLKDAVFLGKAKTTKKWLMVGKGAAFPYVLGRDDIMGHYIEGEIYKVSPKELVLLDRLEGVPTHYRRAVIDCMYTDDFTLENNVLMYVKTSSNIKDYETTDYLSKWIR